ncbi:DNA gyrase inhibitor YacG [Aestuariivirga sp.]|uniref:DNA gyrase inhibitor YacG n=1 Tax=Aestuariivirga sp. TaxID=2650926 RepID=UPI00359425FC
MAEPVRLRPKRPCPICQKPSQQKFHPFCSNRCAQIDLNRWFGGNYAIPVKDDESDEDEQRET